MNDKLISCPLICGKSIKSSTLHKHMRECKKKDLLGTKYEKCAYNYNHIIDISKMQDHIAKCPNRIAEEELEKKRKQEEEENKKQENQNSSSEEELTFNNAFLKADKKFNQLNKLSSNCIFFKIKKPNVVVDLDKKGFGNSDDNKNTKIQNQDNSDITKKRKFNYKIPEIWEMERKLYQEYIDDTKNVFFRSLNEIDSDTLDFYDFLYKGKTFQA